ncbi:MAG: hypothetical protein DMG12_12000 [Acidobacteria bacterium]|nr:MAG: hypothetical protein DMG12_12000 [Acidobacteriota bacterium]
MRSVRRRGGWNRKLSGKLSRSARYRGLHAFFLPVICYLYVLFYGLRGSTPNSERYANDPGNA